MVQGPRLVCPTKEDIQVANKHIQMLPCHMSSDKCKLKQWDTTTCLLEWPKSRTVTIPETMWSNRNSYTLLVGMQSSTHFRRQFAVFFFFFTKLKIFLPHDQSMKLLSVYPKEMKTYVHRKTWTKIFIAALLIIAKTRKQQKCSSIGELISKLC